jgi:CheY-like chemotaxis protein
VPGLAGLTVLANGTIALLLNPLNLLLSREAELPRPVAVVDPAVTAAPVTVDSSAAGQHVVTIPEFGAQVAAEPWVDLPPTITSTTAEPVAATETVAMPVIDKEDVAPVPAPAVAPSDAVVAVERETLTESPPHIPPAEPVVAYAVEARVPVVLIVDDSLTVRKITTRLLEREGYKALTAKDGLDALQILSDVNPDVILLDIEMPRMDGFEFTRTIKADNRQSHIPIIMITSRTAEKHRNHAMELGVNEYVGKPYQDEHLMALIVKYAGKPT